MPFIGRLVDVGVGRETVRGTNVAPGLWIPKTNFSHDLKVAKVRSELSYGRVEAFGNQSLVAQQWAEGELEGVMQANILGYFLYSLFGTLQTSGPVDSLYTHTISVQQGNQHQSLTLATQDPIGGLRFPNAMVDSLELKVVPDDVVRMTVRFMSKPPMDSNDTATYAADFKFLGRDLSFKLANLTSGLAAAAVLSIKSLTLRIKQNLLLDMALGTAVPEDIVNRQLSIDGEFELDYETARTYRNLMRDGTYQAVRIDLTNTRDTIGASSRAQFTLDLSRVDFEQWEREIPNDDLAIQKIQFTALYDITNGNVVNSCTLKNSKASY